MVENNVCYGFFENEWNAKIMRIVLPEWSIKTINIFSKEHNIPCENVVKNIFTHNRHITKYYKNIDCIVFIVTNCSNYLSKQLNVILTKSLPHSFLQLMFTDNYVPIQNGWCYDVTVYAHNVIEHGYCDERELYTTTQMNFLLISTIHEQQIDFTQYDGNIPWNAINYIFADIFIIKTICGF